MHEPEPNGNGLPPAGGLIHLAGWGIGAASVFFALGNKSADPPYVIPFWACFATLTGVSLAYFVARKFSVRWRSPVIRACFSPYLVGATIWTSLFLLFFILDRFFG